MKETDHTDSEDGQQILALARGGTNLLSGQAAWQDDHREDQSERAVLIACSIPWRLSWGAASTLAVPDCYSDCMVSLARCAIGAGRPRTSAKMALKASGASRFTKCPAPSTIRSVA